VVTAYFKDAVIYWIKKVTLWHIFTNQTFYSYRGQIGIRNDD